MAASSLDRFRCLARCVPLLGELQMMIKWKVVERKMVICGVHCLASRRMQQPSCPWANVMMVGLDVVDAISDVGGKGILQSPDSFIHSRHTQDAHPLSFSLVLLQCSCCHCPWCWDVRRQVLEASRIGLGLIESCLELTLT